MSGKDGIRTEAGVSRRGVVRPSSSRSSSALRRALRAPLMIGACVAAGLVIAPTVSRAVTGTFVPLAQARLSQVSLAARGGIGSFTPASGDPRLAQVITVRGVANSQTFRFTPAGSDSRAERSITVAVRVNPETAGVILVRGVLGNIGTTPGAATPLRIAPNAFNLGMARGYQSFAVTSGLGNSSSGTSFSHDVPRIDMPDLSHFSAAGKSVSSSITSATPSRLAPRLALDEKERAGRAPRTLEGQGDYQVDFGGSYRLTRNLDVTAGIRYSSDRDRLRPLTDGKQDSQAVYLGTQFRF